MTGHTTKLTADCRNERTSTSLVRIRPPTGGLVSVNDRGIVETYNLKASISVCGTGWMGCGVSGWLLTVEEDSEGCANEEATTGGAGEAASSVVACIVVDCS